MLRHGCRRPRNSIAEQSQDVPVRLVRMGLPDPRAGNGHAKMHPDFFQSGSLQASLLASSGHPLNPAAPLLDQMEFVEDAPNHAIAQLGDALHDVLNRQAERQKTGILDLDPVIKQSNTNGRSLLGVVRMAMAFISVSRIATNGTDQRSSLRTPSMIDSWVRCLRMNAIASSAARGKSERISAESRRRARLMPAKRPAGPRRHGNRIDNEAQASFRFPGFGKSAGRTLLVFDVDLATGFSRPPLRLD